METKILSTYKVIYEKDMLTRPFKKEIRVIAANFDEAVKKINAIISHNNNSCVINSVTYIGESYI